MKKVYILLLAILAVTSSISAQTYSSRGKDFWMGFPFNFYAATGNCYLNISSAVTTSGTISSPSGWSTAFTVTAGSLTTVNVPLTHVVEVYQTIQNKGLHITSLDTITVNAAYVQSATTDAALLLPTESLGTDYMVLTYPQTLGSYPSGAFIVGTQAGTTVTITPKNATTTGSPAGVPINITLNAGDCYLIGSTTDFTGSTVASSAPVAVFGWVRCSNVPSGSTYCDILWESHTPTTLWGKTFVTGHMMGRTPNTDVFRILAKTAGTQVFINGALVATLAAGAVYETTLSNGNQITSNNDIAVMQFARGSSLHAGNGDPMMIWILPTNLYSKKYLFNTISSTYFTTHHITVYTRTINTGLVKLDGATMGGTWTTIGSSGWSYRTATVSVGLHTLESDSLLCGTVYGWGGVNSYGYFMGGSFLPIVLSESGLQLQGWHNDEGSNFLQWHSTETVSNGQFDIERSEAGGVFSAVRHMEGMSGSSWQYVDEQIQPGTSYQYRIKFTDRTGGVQYSEAITIRTSSPGNWTVYPSVFSTILHTDIEVNEDQWVECSLVDALGKQVYQAQQFIHAGITTLSWEITSGLPAGNYICRVKGLNATYSVTIQKN